MKTFVIEGHKVTLSDELLADFKYTMLYKLTQHEAEGYARAIGTSCFQTDKELSHTVEEFIYHTIIHTLVGELENYSMNYHHQHHIKNGF